MSDGLAAFGKFLYEREWIFLLFSCRIGKKRGEKMQYKLFEIEPVTVYSYGLLIAIGIVSAFFVAEGRAKKQGLNGEEIYGLGILGLIGGVIGAKLLFFLTEIKSIMENPKILLSFSEGFVVYGGILGGILGAYIYCKWKKLPVLKYFDVAVPSLALAQGFGRIGCFLAGCCYGRETGAWYGITFHDSPFAPNGVSLIPTQLLSSGADFLHFFLLIYIAGKKKKDGIVVVSYMIFYSIGRFLIECLRNDPRGNVSILSTSQFISIFMLIAGLIALVMLKKKEQDN